MVFLGIAAIWSTEYNGESVDYDVLFNCDYTPPVDAFISGAPENCYPGESAEYEFHDIQLQVADGVWVDFRWEHQHLLEEEMKGAIGLEISGG